MLVGKNDVQHELQLDNFENAVQNALIDQANTRLNGEPDPRFATDHVPLNLKTDFNLPKDMSNYDIDFNEVR